MEEKHSKDWESTLLRIEKGINKEVFSIKKNPIYKGMFGDEKYELSPTCSICRSMHYIADIYDLSDISDKERNSEIKKICHNMNFEDRKLYYLFFYNKGLWYGRHMYESKNNNPISTSKYYIGPFTDYTVNYIDSLWPTTIEDVLIRINTTDEIVIKDIIITDFKNKVKRWFDENENVSFQKKVLEVIDKWTYLSVSRITKTKFSIFPEKEDELFLAVLGEIKEKRLYRYISRLSLDYLIGEGTHAMSSITCMNDKTECYYASDYLTEENIVPSKSNRCLDYLINYDDFITSFSLCNPNELTMWRLYGDETKGVCVEYEFANKKLPKGFYLAPVSYPQEDGNHIELNFIKFILSELFDYHKLISLHWQVWQRFFKPFGFKVEREIRLLFHPQSTTFEKVKWIFANGIYSPIYLFSIKKDNGDYPLEITRIVLGSKFPAHDVNKELIERRLSEFGLSVKVDTSEIDYYRVNEK